MSTIQHLEKLSPYLDQDQLRKLDKSATRHMEQSSISFSVTGAEAQNLEIEAVQTETPSGKYATETALVKRTEDLFRKALPGFHIKVTTQTVLPSPASVVNAAWIDQKMQQKGIRIKQIAFDTGIDRKIISDWVTGKRSMSQIVKAMFYFYLSR